MISLTDLRRFKAEGRKFSCLTCYDASFAKALEVAEVDTILIGDSLGMTIQGHDSTLPVNIEDMVYHTQNVAPANSHAFIMADLPFMSYATVEDALINSRKVMQVGAHAVKIEGGAWLAYTVSSLTRNGVPVCCQAVVDAGAALLLLECVPAVLAKEVAEKFSVPVIGIGAGVDTDGQVLVIQDMLGLTFGRVARFVRNFMREQSGENAIVDAIKAYHQAVLDKTFPAKEHTFQVEL